MSVSEKQTVEIVKVLYRGVDILILDEPTAVLTPQEAGRLFDILRVMRAEGKAIIIITHKLHEVMAISDRVAVLRKGEHIATVETAHTTEAELTEMMVGKKVELNIERRAPVNPVERLTVEGLRCLNQEGIPVLRDVSFTARAGEILGIAGIADSGSFWSPSPDCSPGRQVPSATITPRTGRSRICGIKRRCRYASWVSGFPSCRRIGWAWDLSATWILPTT